MNVLIGLLALALGAALGWLLARQRTESAIRAALTDAAGLRAALVAERAAAERREALLVRTDSQLGELFGAQAAEALHRNNAAAAARTDTSLAPLRESLERVRQQLAEVERGRASSDTALREQVRTMNDTSTLLRAETTQLVTALRAPQVRGRWGEMQLERVVEAAGMTEHVDYVTQAGVTVPDGSVQRPDLVVQLAGGKRVVVDSKVAFSAYLEAMEARDETTRNDRMRAHARHLKAHIDSLAAKSYWQRFSPSPEFVVCFVPADAFLDAALREQPTLLEYAFAHDVVLATPSTLVALLRTIAYSWRQESLAENAAVVHELGRELYRRLATLGGHFDKLGKSLGNAVGAYNEAVGSLESRVLSTARQMNDLGVVDPGTRIAAVPQLTDTHTRSVTAEELTGQRVVSLHPKTTSAAPHQVSAQQVLDHDGA